METATELAERWPALRVSLISHGPAFAEFSAAARQHVLRSLARLGVALQEHVRVHAVHPDRLSSDAGELAFDACVWAVGFAASPWGDARGSR